MIKFWKAEFSRKLVEDRRELNLHVSCTTSFCSAGWDGDSTVVRPGPDCPMYVFRDLPSTHESVSPEGLREARPARE